MLVHPFGGIHKPTATGSEKIPNRRRSLHRVSVFNSDVRYPKPAYPLETLPDELLEYFFRVFEKDRRETFPVSLLRNLNWKTCRQCGMNFARAHCPTCQKPILSVSQTQVIKGQYYLDSISETSGRFLEARLAGGKLHYLSHEGDTFSREDGTAIFQGSPRPGMQFAIGNETTAIAHHNSLIVFKNHQSPQKFEVDCFNGNSCFALNSSGQIALANQGNLCLIGQYGPETIGSLLPNQSQFWMNETMGFGIQIAGGWKQGFLFQVGSSGLKDGIRLPDFFGKLIGASCKIGKTYIWLQFHVAQNHTTESIIAIYDPQGNRLATYSETSEFNIQNGVSFENNLMIPTDAGLVQYTFNGNQIEITRRIPDTLSIIHRESQLVADRQQLLLLSDNRISRLKLGRGG